MPIRLPMRRRAAPEREAAFRRRTPPTRQATRLMQVSLGAGLLFLAVLGAVFIPKALQYGEVQPPAIEFSHAGQDPFVVSVSRISRAYALDQYRVEFNATNAVTNGSVNVGIPRLGPSGSWDGGNLTFSDEDDDGTLSLGDAFTIQPYAGGSWAYKLLVFYIPRDAGAQPPCPCAAGIWRFPQ